MVQNFVNGGAGISVICKQHNIHLRVIDGGVDYDFPEELNVESCKLARGTRNMRYEPAMTIELCQTAMNKGAEYVRQA